MKKISDLTKRFAMLETIRVAVCECREKYFKFDDKEHEQLYLQSLDLCLNSFNLKIMSHI